MDLRDILDNIRPTLTCLTWDWSDLSLIISRLNWNCTNNTQSFPFKKLCWLANFRDMLMWFEKSFTHPLLLFNIYGQVFNKQKNKIHSFKYCFFNLANIVSISPKHKYLSSFLFQSLIGGFYRKRLSSFIFNSDGCQDFMVPVCPP